MNKVSWPKLWYLSLQRSKDGSVLRLRNILAFYWLPFRNPAKYVNWVCCSLSLVFFGFYDFPFFTKKKISKFQFDPEQWMTNHYEEIPVKIPMKALSFGRLHVRRKRAEGQINKCLTYGTIPTWSILFICYRLHRYEPKLKLITKGVDNKSLGQKCLVSFFAR